MTTEMTVKEIDDFTTLDIRIEKGLKVFYEVGEALKEIRDRKLYRMDYETFEEYCKKRHGMTKTHANRLIESGVVVNQLKSSHSMPFKEPAVSGRKEMTPIGVKTEMTPMGVKSEDGQKVSPMGENPKVTPMGVKSEPELILPTNERQTRELSRVPAEQQPEVWKQAVARSTEKGVPITARVIKDVVEEVVEPKKPGNLEGVFDRPKMKPTEVEVVRSNFDRDQATDHLYDVIRTTLFRWPKEERPIAVQEIRTILTEEFDLEL